MQHMAITNISINTLEQDFAQLERLGSKYNYGGKAMIGGRYAKDSELKSVTPAQIAAKGVDCSGYVRWALARATDGRIIVPDGSQNQRVWAEKNLRKVKYADAAFYINPARLFIAFIKPWTNGCGSVGHVWFLSHYDTGKGTVAGTLESHGGGGCVSRAWNYRTLVQQVYSCFELTG